MSNLSKLRKAVLAVAASMAVVLSGAVPAVASGVDSASLQQIDFTSINLARTTLTIENSGIGGKVTSSTTSPFTLKSDGSNLEDTDGYTVTRRWAYFSGCLPGPDNSPRILRDANDVAVPMDDTGQLIIPSSIKLQAIDGGQFALTDLLLSGAGHFLSPVFILSKSGFQSLLYNGPIFEVGGDLCPTAQGSNPPQQNSAPTPYTGPILQTPGAVAPVAQGSKVVIPGSNLSGVSKVEIGGVDAKVVVNSAGELEITVPVGLAAGTYDLVVTSDSGRLTVQDGIRVSGSAAVSETNESTARPSTKLKEDNTVKVYVFEVVGAGKVQIMFNGKEIAWVNTTDPNDSKLLNEYLVRTLELVDGKNVIEVFVDGERERRTVYSN